MDNPDPRSAVSAVVAILRKATRFFQIIPFVYLFLYGLYMVAGAYASDEILCLADSILFASPVATVAMLAASKVFKLCRWHKAACLIPSSSQVEGYIDSFVFTFTQDEIFFINLAIGILSIVFLSLAIRHFVHAAR